MINYTGQECPYCKKPISSDEEMAVCPECGTPHHRSCYVEHGECANAHMHGSGFEWKPPVNEEDVVTDIVCPACGRMNPPGNIFCGHCGADLRGVRTQHEDRSEPTADSGLTTVGGGLFGELNLTANFPPKLFDIPTSDWVTYLGSNQYSYLYHFSREQRTGSRFSFSIIAALFPFLFFLYRKLWMQAGVAFAINLIISPIAVVGMDASLLPMFSSLTGIAATTLETASMIASIVLLVVNIVWGLLAHGFVKKTGIKRISAARAQYADDEQYKQNLGKKGGVCRGAVLGVICGYAALLLLESLLIGGIIG